MSKADNKELEKAIYRIETHKDYAGLANGTCVVNKQDIETVLKELKRLQEENKKMEIEIANHVYWESTPVNEIKKMYVPKDKIREKIEELKGKEENTYLRIKELENIVGMSLEEYEELNKLYCEYNEILIKIEILEELLDRK